MRTEISNTIFATDRDAQYDESAKRLLGQKSILAHILTKTVDEFAGMDPKDVALYIEGEPFINKVPVEPGVTNAVTSKDGARVVGFNSESQELHEGMIRFDIIFYVRMKDGLTQIIINVEAQKEEKYELHRLLSALLSSDLEVEDKLDIMEKEYDIPLENDIRKDVKEMCNLSQGIREEAFEEGQEYGYREGQEKGEKQKLVRVVTKMHEAKFPLEQIAAIAEISVENVKEIID